jgi:2-polyprenyl-3-methyl-5-hydroxy-6-metoxy-1,4-benzoquinol methylase
MSRASDNARSRFGEHAEEYVASATHAAGDDLELLISLAAVTPGEAALDVATGGGHVALALARAGARVTACDLAPEMLDAAKRHLASQGLSATFVEAAADALPFSDESFDLVTCRIAAHHFPDVEAFFAEASRVLKPHGRLAFQDQALPDDPAAAETVEAFEWLRDPSHVHARSVAGWIAIAGDAGLQVEAQALVDKRHDFAEWCAMQACSEEVVAALTELAANMGPAATEWMEPAWEHGAHGRTLKEFTNRHLVMLAHKPVA